MKKKLLSLAISLVMIISICPIVSFACNKNTLKNDFCWEIKDLNKVVLGSEVDNNINISVSKAHARKTEQGKIEYIKKVELKNKFFLSDSKDYISGHIKNIYFKYDNESVEVEDEGIETSSVYNSDLWKTSCNEEIYTTPKQCISSQKIYVYKRPNMQKNWKNSDEFHIDIICLPNGEINFNVKSSDEDPNKAKATNTIKNNKEAKKGIKRCVIESNKEYTNDLNDDTRDKYRYVTKELEVIYMDEYENYLGKSLIKANFRYNKDTNEVQCLSTSHKEDTSRIKVKMRTGNETRTYGGAYGEINLVYMAGCTSADYEESVVIKCDSKGNISSQFM